MKVCAACGVENPDIARFCLACGTQLAEARPPQETRKVVTIVFSDLKGSTSLGEALDSEALREVMTRYFDAMRGELERHGGVIEKFIGDAVMAVFGLPRLHEDDALRAVRAASGMQAALEALNDELQLVYGVQLANRTGVNTGEVVAGDPSTGQRLVTGDAVNVAARLEQAAGEREVLLGELTYRLVRDDVDVEEVEPLELKGKSEPVPAYRLVGVRARSDASTPTNRAARRPRRRARDARVGTGRGGRVELLPSRDDRRRRGRREVQADVRVPRCVQAAGARFVRPVPPLRRGDHVLAGRGGREGPGWHRQRRLRDGGAIEARLARGPGGRRRDGSPRVRSRLVGRAVPGRGAVLGRAAAPHPSRCRAPRDLRRRGHPLGRADDARPDRKPGRGVHRAGARHVPDPARAPRGVSGVEHGRALGAHRPRATRHRALEDA